MFWLIILVFILFFFFKNLIKIFLRLPKLFYFKIYDIYKYFKNKEWRLFNGYGLHIYIGMFGSGKTLSLVKKAKKLAKQYPYLTILTNIELIDFPYPERVFKLENYQQIIKSPPNTLIVIDEISTLFNSRKWADFPIPLLYQILQVRKNKKMIIATAQRFSHVDKLLRDVTTTVIDCNCLLGRLTFNTTYDACDYENTNLYLPKPLNFNVFVATNKLFNSYDTFEIVDNSSKDKFLSNSEILENRMYSVTTISPTLSKKQEKQIFSNKRKK